MSVRAISEPVVEPLTVEEAKRFLNTDDTCGTDDDALIASFIKVARILAEAITRRAFVQRTVELDLEGFHCRDIFLPLPPLQSVEFIKYKDAGGNLATLDSSLYQVDTYGHLGRIRPAYLNAWPALFPRGEFNAVQIRYVAGYAPVAGSPVDYASGIPEIVKQWMRVRIQTSDQFRESIITGTIVTELKQAYVDGLLDSLCVDTF